MKVPAPLSVIEQSLVAALTAAIVRELQNDERAERLGTATARDVRGDDDREHDGSYTTP